MATRRRSAGGRLGRPPGGRLGRPPFPPGRARRSWVHIRVRPGWLEWARGQAELLGYESLSDMIRQALAAQLGRPPEP